MKKTLWKQSSRSLRMEQLENRELLSATTWSNAIDADAAVAAEMSTALSNATVDLSALSTVTTLDDSDNDTDGKLSLREALKNFANNSEIDTITFAEGLNGEIELTSELRITVKTLSGTTRGLTIDASNVDVTIDAQEASRVFNVVATENSDAIGSLTFKGLAIANGNVEGNGAAINAVGYNVTVDGCDFANNEATGNGGAVYAATVTVTDSTFAGNSAVDGGAIYAASTTKVTGSEFANNAATGNGGAVYAKNATVTGSEFSGNVATGNGGGFYVTSTSPASSLTPNITSSTFTNNSAQNGGGFYSNTAAIIASSTFSENKATKGAGGGFYAVSNVKVTGDSAFTGNSATGNGGGFYAKNGSAGSVLEDVTVSGNNAVDGGGFYIGRSYKVGITNATITDNTANGSGGGFFVDQNATLTVVDSAITGNTANGSGSQTGGHTGGGGFFSASNAKSTVTNTTIANNKSFADGGGFVAMTAPTVTNATITGNYAAKQGGGFARFSQDGGVVANTLIVGNEAGVSGGGVHSYKTSFYNVTIVGNKAPVAGAVGVNGTAVDTFYNSIILANPTADVENSGAYDENGVALAGSPYAYNVLSTFTGWKDGSENVIAFSGDIDDVFADPANGDYTLALDSQAVGAGNNEYVTADTDLAGNPRIQADVVDLGAYECDYGVLAQPTFTVEQGDSNSDTLKSSLEVFVTPQANATNYVVTVAAEAFTADGQSTINPFVMFSKELGKIDEVTKATFDELDPNANYYVWVLPIGDDSFHTPTLPTPSTIYTTKSVQLATPKLDELVTMTANSISFDFAQDNQGKASSYFVLYQKDGDAGWKFSPAKAGETFTIDGLEIGGTYNVMAVAYGDNVTYYDSLFSNAYTFTTPKYDLAAPSIVVGEVGKSASIKEGQVKVVVGDVEFATKYSVYYTTENPYAEDGSLKDVEWTLSGKFDDVKEEKTYSYTATGLAANTTYWFRAEASADETYYNSSVSVDYASATTAKVYLQAPTLALTPDAYVANDELTTSITATFNAVDNAAGYRIYWTTNASNGLGTWNFEDVAADVSEYKIEGLAPNQKYNVRVVALSDNDVYLNSNTEGAENKYLGDREITTVRAQLAAPTFTVEGVKANREALLVTIDAVNKADKYNVSWVDDQGETQTVELTDGALTYTIEGLTVNTSYDVTVEAIGAEAYVASKATVAGTTLKYDMPSGLPTISVVADSVTATTVQVEVGGVYSEVEEQYEEVVLDENDEPVLDENGEVVKETKTRIIFVYDVATEGYKLQYKLADSEDDWTTARDLAADLVSATYTVEGLCPNCKYDFRVVANETETHYGKESASASATMKYGVLATPTFTVTADTNCVGSSSVTISIDAVDNATAGYTVFYKLTDSSVWAGATFDAAGEHQIEGLSPNKSYDFLVYANDTGHYAPNYEDGSVATTVKTERAKLNAPEYTLTGADKALTVTIEKDPNAVFYVVQYCKDGTDLWTTVAGAVRETSYTIEGLEEGTQYHVRLQAFATSDYYSSDIVEESGWTNKAALAVPGISVAGAVSSSTTSSVTINLTASEGANRYEIYYRVDGTSEWTTFENAVVGSNTIENLAPNKLYWFTAKAFNDAQPEDTVYASVSAEAEWQYKLTPKGSFDLNAPGVVEITKDQDSITVNVNREEGCDANYPYYLVQYKGADGQWIYNSIDATQLSYTITGLNPGETYEVQVEAFAANQDDYNDSTVFETTVTLDKAGQLAAPTVSVYSVDGTAITVMVQGDVAVDTNGYVLQYATNADFSDAISVDAVFGANQIDGLTGRTYYFRAQAKEVTEYSASDWAVADETIAIKPQSPGEIGFTQYRGGNPSEAVDLDGTWLRVKWDYCENDVEYVLSYRVSGTAEWTPVDCPASLVNPTTGLAEAKAGAYMYDLQPGVSYDFMVYAVDPNNADNISEGVSFATFTMMDAPEVSAAFDAATGMIQVSWTTDETDVTKYRVEVLTAPFESVANVNKADNAYYHCGGAVAADQTSYSFDTLNASQTYYIRVSSYVGSNMSAWTYAEVKFDAPTDLTFAQYQGFTRVKWADVANESGYRVEYRAVGETEWTVGAETKADVATAAIYGLNGGTTYEYRVVAAFNGVEGGAASDVATFDCLATPEVKSTALNKSGNRIVFAWFGVEGVDSYRVECSTSANFDENVKAITTSGTNQSFAMEAGKTYYFRVRANQATSKEGWSNWSEVAEFTAPAADVVSEAFVDLFAEEAEDDFWFEFEEALGGRSK